MRRILLAAAACGVAAPVSAEITLSGNARLGVGYGVMNNGDPWLEPTRSVTVDRNGAPVEVDTVLGAPDDEVRALSRVRFIFTGVGESDSGIAFGASIRADNAASGGTGTSSATGQTAGNVFVSGAWGTLSYGDVDGADYQRVGDPISNVTLTGLGDYNQLPFLSNGGGSDNDELQFLADPDVRPTVRYDYDFAGFGLSLSTDRELDAVGVGAGYTFEFDDGEVSLGLGYYDFSAFEGDIAYYGEVDVPDGSQWSASLRGTYGDFQAGLGYASIRAGDLGELDVLAGGAGYTYQAWTAFAYYSRVVDGGKLFGEALDGKDSYGASLQYDLGGGATLNMGVARTFGADAVGAPEEDQFAPAVDATTLADFGITLTF